MKIGERIPVQENGLGLCDLCHKSEIESARPGELRDFYAATENGVDYVVCETCGERRAPFCYEDELPASISDSEYSDWFAASAVVDGVRVGPRRNY